MLLTRRAALLLALPVALVLVAYVGWPNLVGFVEGLRPDAWARLLGSGSGRAALVNSVGVSLLTVVGAGVVGTGLAWALWRYDLPGRGALAALAALPLALPPLVGVLAFFFLYGESGMLPRGLQVALGLREAPLAFSGLGAVLAVHVYAFYVYPYLFARAALGHVDAALLEASADLGAGGWTTTRRVVLPLLRPALVGASLLVFMLSMGSFTAPLLFAGDEPFLTTLVYQSKIANDLPRSAAAAALLTVLCLAFLLLIEGRGGAAGGGATKGVGRAVVPARGAGAAVAGALTYGALALVALPVLTVLLLSFVEEGTWTTQVLPPAYTLANYAALATEPDVAAPLLNSLWMAALATAANVLVGVAAALVIARTGLPGRGLLRALALLPFAIPGTVVALNLILTFDEPTALAGGAVLVGTVWLLPLAYFVRHLPLVTRAAQAAFEAFDGRLAEASADLGAGAGVTFRRVVWPLVRPGVAAGALLTFVTALGEFVASVLLYVYGNRPISVEVFAQLRLYDFGAAAAYSVLLMALVGAAVAVARRAGAA